jgi:hypothetical protein
LLKPQFMENNTEQESEKPVEPPTEVQPEMELEFKPQKTSENMLQLILKHLNEYSNLYTLITSVIAIVISIIALSGVTKFEGKIEGMNTLNSIFNDATAINRHPYFVIEEYKDSSTCEKIQSFSNPNGIILKNIGTYAIAVDAFARTNRKGVAYTSHREKKIGNQNNCDANENFVIIFDNSPVTTDPDTPEDMLSPNQRIDFTVSYKGLNGKSYKQEIIIEHDYQYNIYPPVEE